MKKFITLIFTLVILSSCAHREMMQLSDGSYITKRKFERNVKKSFKKALKSLSKEEKNLILDSDVNFEYSVKERKD